jgi:protein-S-isoprenylcysteine O-methyltransferase Ste14
MNENIFRILAGVILLSGMSISFYFRMKADRNTGEKVSRKVDGAPMMYTLMIGGLILWFSPFVYLSNPAWMAWAKLGLPEWVRWAGVVLGALGTAGIYWLFSSIGSGISPASGTRKEHVLVTHGIYRYVRHPLYTLGSSMFITFGMTADNWFIALLGILAFIAVAIRTPKEEANLIAKFGEEYREYMKQTGRFWPRLLK